MQFAKRLLLRLKASLVWLLRSESALMYTSIDNLPTSKWWKINETHNYTLLLKSDITINQKIYDKCESIWNDINDSHNDKFGVPKAFKDYYRELASLYRKKIKAAINGGSDESHYEFAQIRFDAQYKGKKANNFKLKNSIERVLNLSYRIDPDVMPIVEFSSLVELANETAENG